MIFLIILFLFLSLLFFTLAFFQKTGSKNYFDCINAFVSFFFLLLFHLLLFIIDRVIR